MMNFVPPAKKCSSRTLSPTPGAALQIGSPQNSTLCYSLCHIAQAKGWRGRGFGVQRASLAKMGQSLPMYSINLPSLCVCLCVFVSLKVRPVSVTLSNLANEKGKGILCITLIVIDHLRYVNKPQVQQFMNSAILSLTYKAAPPRQAMCLRKHVYPCVTSPTIPVRPENMQRLEVMAQITVPRLGVSLVVFTEHCTTGIQSVAFNNPTDALMAYDLYTEIYIESYAH